MWVSSKVAAEMLKLNYEQLAKAINRANKSDKKICQTNGKYLQFNYSDGIGAGGKVLQIWIDGSSVVGDVGVDAHESKQNNQGIYNENQSYTNSEKYSNSSGGLCVGFGARGKQATKSRVVNSSTSDFAYL